MAHSVVRRTIKVRHSPRPAKGRKAPAGGFAGLLSRLNEASARLQRSRPRRGMA
ncbi:MAG TPA: hypothetical protein VG269_20860 [Tepidisphaeraceae bacterium]|jgi:hypothetical protein|nr:hypothetical protein [Tepidisphaeraceae bacterium]